MGISKTDLLARLNARAAEEYKWAERLKHDYDERVGHLSAGWAFNVAILIAEELDD